MKNTTNPAQNKVLAMKPRGNATRQFLEMLFAFCEQTIKHFRGNILRFKLDGYTEASINVAYNVSNTLNKSFDENFVNCHKDKFRNVIDWCVYYCVQSAIDLTYFVNVIWLINLQMEKNNVRIYI